MTRIRVFCSSAEWGLSGVNVFTANLVRGLIARGFDARMLGSSKGISPRSWGEVPRDLPWVDLGWRWYDGGVARWRRISRFLAENEPCLYLPGYDFFSAWKSTQAPDGVHVIGILHSDESCYYRLGSDLGRHYAAVVAVSEFIAAEVRRQTPDLDRRLTVIPYGVSCPEEKPPCRGSVDGSLRVIYAGRLLQYQKRIFDLPEIMGRAEAAGVPMDLTIVGGGPDREALVEVMQPWIDAGRVKVLAPLPNERIRRLFAEHDVFLLTSDFEGLPVALLEAMSEGCTPVVSAVRSGVRDVVIEGANGHLVPIGDTAAFAASLSGLHADRERLRRMSLAAHRRIREGGFTLDAMCDRYAELFDRVARQRRRSPQRSAVPRPAGMYIRAHEFLPSWVRLGLFIIARCLRWMARLAKRARRLVSSPDEETRRRLVRHAAKASRYAP